MAVKVDLYRYYSGPRDTLGLLFVNGEFHCFTLEDEYRSVKVMHETRIPAGEYRVNLHTSPKYTPKFGHQMLLVENVPGFTGILFHPGNDEDDTSGCILVGHAAHLVGRLPAVKNKIMYSRDAYFEFYGLVAPHTPFPFTIYDHVP